MLGARFALWLLLALVTAPAFAQDETAPDDTPSPPVEQPPQPPADPAAPLIAGPAKEPPGPPVDTQPKCECCGLYWEQSPTRVEAVVIRSGGPKENANYESIACLLRDEAKEEVELVKFSVLDYATAGTENPKLLASDKAFYLYGTRPIPGSSAPYIAAFETEAKARGAQDWLEGKAVLEYGAMLRRYQADLAADIAAGKAGEVPLDAVIPPGEDWFVCPCAGGCCDHIRSDSEGACPDCGLQLVRRSEKLRLQRERAGIKDVTADEGE